MKNINNITLSENFPIQIVNRRNIGQIDTHNKHINIGQIDTHDKHIHDAYFPGLVQTLPHKWAG